MLVTTYITIFSVFYDACFSIECSCWFITIQKMVLLILSGIYFFGSWATFPDFYSSCTSIHASIRSINGLSQPFLASSQWLPSIHSFQLIFMNCPELRLERESFSGNYFQCLSFNIMNKHSLLNRGTHINRIDCDAEDVHIDSVSIIDRKIRDAN